MTAITRAYNWLKDGNAIDGQMIADIIRENSDTHDRQLNLYERFKASKDGVPIHKREFKISQHGKINNKLANDFFSDIINTKIGYFAGKPVSYKYTIVAAGGNIQSSENVDLMLKGFLKRNQISDLDSETAKMAAITGMASRLCYNDLDGEGAIINVPPWECVFICDEIGVTDADYAIRYYCIERKDKKYIKAEFYDDTTISFWIREEDTSKSNEPFTQDPDDDPMLHLMTACPLICFPNNEEMLGDCDKVLSLIDGYDKTLSDVNSEIEQFRLAYLAFYGSVPDDTTLEKLKQTGAIGFPEATDKMEYVTKQLNDVAVENHLNRLETNILYFAQSVRFSDESFGQASGVAMKFKLFNLEAKCMTAERKFTKALYRQFEVLKDYFGKKSITYDPWNFEFTFTRNFPLNLLDEAQSLATLKGLVSDKTAFSQMSFIPDPEKEIELMQAEQEEYNKANAAINAAMQDQNQQLNQGGNPDGTVQTQTPQMNSTMTQKST